jgi:AcrR family transcriptional regulator
MKKNIGRPKAFDENKALEKAMYYFWEHGYESAGLTDLLTAMGIKKSSFYQTFESKENLFRMSLELYTQNSEGYFNAQKEQHGAKGALIELMNLLLKEVQNTGHTKGCLVMNAGGECYTKFGHLSPLVQAKFKDFQKLFMSFIDEAQELGDIDPKKDAFELVTVYQSIINGASAMVRAGAGEKEVSVLVAQVKELLQ